MTFPMRALWYFLTIEASVLYQASWYQTRNRYYRNISKKNFTIHRYWPNFSFGDLCSLLKRFIPAQVLFDIIGSGPGLSLTITFWGQWGQAQLKFKWGLVTSGDTSGTFYRLVSLAERLDSDSLRLASLSCTWKFTLLVGDSGTWKRVPSM